MLVEPIDITKYNILEKISIYQVSTVYKIKDKITGKNFAAKIYNESSKKSEKENLSFKNELKIMTMMSHPNIIKFIGYSPIDFKKKKKAVIITEFLPDQTLADTIEKESKGLAPSFWDETYKLIIIYGLAKTMAYLHEHGIIYRDLNPSNIYLDEFLGPVISNFELAAEIDSKEPKILFGGTPSYAAPEIFSDLPYTPASDVYAFGMIVFEIISGEKPFKNATLYSFVTSIISGLRPDFPKEIPNVYQILISSCWDQDPESRPTFNEIADVLKNNRGFITDLIDEKKYQEYINNFGSFKHNEQKNETLRRRNTTKEYTKPLEGLEDQKQKVGVQDRVAMYNKIKVMGAPAAPPAPTTVHTTAQVKSNSNEDNKSGLIHSPNIAPGISEKKAIFESRSGDLTNNEPKQEPKFGLRANNNPNSKATANRSAIQSQIVTSNNKIVPNDNNNSNNKSREVPLISSTNDNQKNKEKETPSTSNRNSGNSNKYKESLNQKIAMFNNSPNNSSNNITFNIKKEEPKKSEPKKSEPKKEEPKKSEPKKEEPKKSEPKKEEPKKEDPKKSEPNKVESKKEGQDENKYLDLNNYEIGMKVGQGGFGKVYCCQNKKTGEKYAAKVSKSLIKEEDKNAMLNIYREVNIMASISHPAVLKFIGYSPVNFNGKKKPVIINEFAPNGSLKHIIFQESKGKKIQGWDATKKLINVYGIAAGMAFLHLNRVVHRDLKPENILLDDYLFPKISDFGLAKQIHENEQSVTMESQAGFKGTLLYMPPELYDDNKAYSEASDVYSFGIILYELYSGLFIFKGNIYILPNQIHEGWRPDIKKQVPEAYKDLIVKCWSQNPSDRLTFQEIVDLLENDSSFLTNDVNKEDFRKYVDFIKHSQSSYDKGKKIIELKGPSFQKVSINQNDESEE
ncbi:hypothetical protein M9Y10_025291 [Tritrichomonas musculus]|uniref:Protein kinase domain-containing protein n=1 Tax=Tritrichomonas musculus TaxID=1915356 RepID=A0ABR2HA51_9EUKA